MAKSKVVLTEEQKLRNAQILARLEAEEQSIREDTRQLQREWRRNRRKRTRARRAHE